MLGLTPTFYQPAGDDRVHADRPERLEQLRPRPDDPVQRRDWGYRGIAAYQVWNEANVKNYWTGTPAADGAAHALTYAAVKAVDRGALVVGPAFADRIAEQTRGIGFFYFYRFPVNRTPVWNYIDAISLNLYPRRTARRPARRRSRWSCWPPRAADAAARRPGQQADLEHRDQLRPASRGGTGALARSRPRAAGGVRATDLPAQRRRRHRAGPLVRLGHAGPGNTGCPPGSTRRAHAGRQGVQPRAVVAVRRKAGHLRQSAKPCAKDRAGTYTCVIAYSRASGGCTGTRPRRSRSRRPGPRPSRWGSTPSATIKGGSTSTVDYRPLMVRSKF